MKSQINILKEDNSWLNSDLENLKQESSWLKSLLKEKDGGMAQVEEERQVLINEKVKEI